MGVKLKKMNCPHCGAQIDMKLKGVDFYYCPYCGHQSSVDDGNRTITYNQNINIHKRFTDDAAIKSLKWADKHDKREFYKPIIEVVAAFLPLCILVIVSWGMVYFGDTFQEKEEQKKIDAGMIKVGQSSEDMEGQNYKAVMEQLRTAGFENIVDLDLEDNTWILFNDDEVVNVSIGGETSFYSSDYFYPDAEIVISHH